MTSPLEILFSSMKRMFWCVRDILAFIFPEGEYKCSIQRGKGKGNEESGRRAVKVFSMLKLYGHSRDMWSRETSRGMHCLERARTVWFYSAQLHVDVVYTSLTIASANSSLRAIYKRESRNRSGTLLNKLAAFTSVLQIKLVTLQHG